jgi:DNA polymerase III subunit epsilon
MIILGLDFETTGFSPVRDRVIEVGAVLWDTKSHAPVRIVGVLVKSDVRNSAGAMAVNHITNEMLDQWGISSRAGYDLVARMMQTCDAVCAHNGTTFDKPFVEEWSKRETVTGLTGEFLPKRVWLDTKTDIAGMENKKLIYLAAEHGFVNPFPHKAATDVLTMLRVLDGYDIETIFARKKDKK